MPTRRHFLRSSAMTGFAASAAHSGNANRPTVDELDRAAGKRVLHVNELKSPVRIASMELLRAKSQSSNQFEYLVRVRSSDGAEGLAVANSDRLRDCWPIFLRHVAPFFIGKDARSLDDLHWELYRHNSNYKLQGIALWAPTAAAEFAIFDLLGKLTKQSIGQLLGGVVHRDVAIYRASGNRGNTPEAEIAYLKQIVAECGAKALKFRLGGRMMRNNQDSLPGRTERLIPLVREAFGPSMTLYADSNSSYDVREAIRLGRLMEKHNYAFYEEPVEFDDLEGTKQVTDALTMPVAGGEQEFSEWRFRWMIHHRAVDIVQPDLHYYGGFIRTVRVARMAEAAGMKITLHMSGGGLGYLDAVHCISALPNALQFQEYKGNSNIPMTCDTSTLAPKDGVVRVPSGPGFGIVIDPEWVKAGRRVT